MYTCISFFVLFVHPLLVKHKSYRKKKKKKKKKKKNAYTWSPSPGIDAKIFGVDANMVGIKANANVEITNQNNLSKSLCIDSCQYIHFQYLRLDCSKETEQWHMISGEQETSMSGNGTIWALTR